MMSVTHCAIATCGVAAALGTADPVCLVLASIGSQLPDCDTTSSWAGACLYPIAAAIEHRFPHRTITHSFLSTAIVSLLAAPLWVWGWQYWASLVIGQFLGWFADSFTRSGVAAFYPSPVRLVIPGNPKARMRAGSRSEYWVLGICIVLSVIFINLSSAGGITEQFARTFFNDTATAARLFNKHGSDRTISIDVIGQNITTSQPVRGSFTVIEATDSDLIGESSNDGQLYKIGTAPDVQVQPSSVKTTLGDRISLSAQPQVLQEIGVADWLKRLPQNSYISGSLLLDDMESLRLVSPVGVFPSLRVFGGQLELSNARPHQLAAQLREFWILQGQVVVKVRK
ncbi:MAG: metal-dependent hydrolase [Leptolyngbyaceae cyanobacterium bins.302]|nr:metal-dependent hydrolase [Leptolyngbyaceae cyanobacterium bins.302]